MNQEKSKWVLKAQECAGSYEFNGKLYITTNLAKSLPTEEICAIIAAIQERVAQGNGADYLQVLEDGIGKRIFAIDQLNREMKAGGGYSPGDNHWTLMWDWEY